MSFLLRYFKGSTRDRSAVLPDLKKADHDEESEQTVKARTVLASWAGSVIGIDYSDEETGSVVVGREPTRGYGEWAIYAIWSIFAYPRDSQ